MTYFARVDHTESFAPQIGDTSGNFFTAGGANAGFLTRRGNLITAEYNCQWSSKGVVAAGSNIFLHLPSGYSFDNSSTVRRGSGLEYYAGITHPTADGNLGVLPSGGGGGATRMAIFCANTATGGDVQLTGADFSAVGSIYLTITFTGIATTGTYFARNDTSSSFTPRIGDHLGNNFNVTSVGLWTRQGNILTAEYNCLWNSKGAVSGSQVFLYLPTGFTFDNTVFDRRGAALATTTGMVHGVSGDTSLVPSGGTNGGTDRMSIFVSPNTGGATTQLAEANFNTSGSIHATVRATVVGTTSTYFARVDETGSFTPQIGDNAGANFFTMTGGGIWTRQGNLVTVEARYAWSSKGTVAAGSAIFLYLPSGITFDNTNVDRRGADLAWHIGVNYSAGGGMLAVVPSGGGGGSNRMSVFSCNDSGAVGTQLTAADCSTAGNMYITYTFAAA